MRLTEALDRERREHVEARLRHNVMAWLTTVGPNGRPSTVPVWFLVRDDDTVALYSEPNAPKLRHLAENPHVTLGLDVTDLGRDVIRLSGEARRAEELGPAAENGPYVAKYAERIGALFNTPGEFSARYSVPVLITPERLWA